VWSLVVLFLSRVCVCDLFFFGLFDKIPSAPLVVAPRRQAQAARATLLHLRVYLNILRYRAFCGRSRVEIEIDIDTAYSRITRLYIHIPIEEAKKNLVMNVIQWHYVLLSIIVNESLIIECECERHNDKDTEILYMYSCIIPAVN